MAVCIYVERDKSYVIFVKPLLGNVLLVVLAVFFIVFDFAQNKTMRLAFFSLISLLFRLNFERWLFMMNFRTRIRAYVFA